MELRLVPIWDLHRLKIRFTTVRIKNIRKWRFIGEGDSLSTNEAGQALEDEVMGWRKRMALHWNTVGPSGQGAGFGASDRKSLSATKPSGQQGYN